MADLPIGAHVAAALMAANIDCDSGEDVDRFLSELTSRGWRVVRSRSLTAKAIRAVQDEVLAELRAKVGEHEAGIGLPHWHHASGGTTSNPAENDRAGVFVDRAAVLNLLAEHTETPG